MMKTSMQIVLNVEYTHDGTLEKSYAPLKLKLRAVLEDYVDAMKRGIVDNNGCYKMGCVEYQCNAEYNNVAVFDD